MIDFRKAKADEAEIILKFYRKVIISIEGSEFRPKWGNYYPNLEYIKESIEMQELYVCTKNDTVIASVVLNNRFEPEYENIDWGVDAKPDEIAVIHAFAVASNLAGKGIGREIFNQIRNMAVKNNLKSIRLDIIDGNAGAQKVFGKLGFKYINSIEIVHKIVGFEKFHLYEFILR